MAVQQNITQADLLFTGTDIEIYFTFTGRDITGYTLSFVLTRRGTTLLTKTTPTGIVLTDPAAAAGGVCKVVIADSDFVDEDDNQVIFGGVLYKYELKRTNAGLELVEFFGNCVFNQSLHTS